MMLMSAPIDDSVNFY